MNSLGKDIEILKGLILESAIQGNLTMRDPKDEDAKILFSKIKDSQIKLVAKKNAVITDSFVELPFTIPENWVWTRLGDIVNQITDGTHKTPQYKSNGIPFLSIKDISAGTLDFSNCKFISKEEHAELIRRCRPEKGDILLCRIGTLGKPVIVDTSKEFSIFVSLGLLKFQQDLLLPEYLRFVLKSNFIKDYFNRIKVGGGTHTNKLNLEDLYNVPIPLSPQKEQQSIVNKVNELFRFCEQLEKKGVNLEEKIKHLKSAILQEAIMGKLVPQKSEEANAEVLLDNIQKEKEKLIKLGKLKKEKPLPVIKDTEIPFKIPDSWKWVRLPDIVDFTNNHSIKRGPFGSTLRKEYFVEKGYKVYEQKNAIRNDFDIGNYFITRDKFMELEGFSVKPLDIIISCSGTVGKIAIVPKNAKEGIINQALLKLSLNSKVCINEYFKYMFQGYFISTEGISNAKGSAIKNVASVAILKSTPLPLPPFEEQKRIIEKITELNKTLDTILSMIVISKNKPATLDIDTEIEVVV